MTHQNYNPSQQQSHSFQNLDQVAFSFESRSHQLHARAADKHRTIEKYLRLKTNQSIDDKFSAPQSTQDQNQQYNGGKRRISLNKNLKTSEVQSSSIQYHKHLMQQEYELRIQSLLKQFQLKFNKQEDYCKLIQWKYKEEIENLNQQIHALQQSKKRYKKQNKTLLSNCSVCSDGQVINHLKNIINQVESTHQSCLSNKKQLTKQLDDTRNKLQALQSAHEKLQGQCKHVNKQLRASNNDNLKFHQENQALRSELSKIRMQLTESNDKTRHYKQKYQSYQYKLKDYQHKHGIYQGQIKNRQDDLNHISKTAPYPLPTSALASIENSMNSSFLRQRDSNSKHKNSISQISIQEGDDKHNENRQYFKKLQQNPKGSRVLQANSKISNQRIQNLKWKYF